MRQWQRSTWFGIALLLLPWAAPAWAQQNPGDNLPPAQTGVSASALTSSPTMTLRTAGFGTLTVYVALTRAAATALKMTCTGGPSAAVQAPIPVAAVDSVTGAISMASASWTYPITASGTYRMLVSPLNDQTTVCTFTGTAATSSDIVSVYARLGAY